MQRVMSRHVRMRMEHWVRMWVRHRMRMEMVRRMVRMWVRHRMWMWMVRRMVRMTVVMPPMPAYWPTPAYAFMEVLTAPVPTAAVPAIIVPAIAAPRVNIVFRFGASSSVAHPSLGIQLGALRQHEWCSFSYRCAVDRDTEAIRAGDSKHALPIFERLKLPNLVIAAIAFGNDDWVARTWDLPARRCQTVEAIPTNRQGSAALKTKRLIGFSAAA